MELIIPPMPEVTVHNKMCLVRVACGRVEQNIVYIVSRMVTTKDTFTKGLDL